MSDSHGEPTSPVSLPEVTSHDTVTRKQPALWERHPTLTAGLISVIAALLAGVIGYLGAVTGANASLDVAKAQTQAENERRAQDRRDTVYKDYLDAANHYFYAWDAIRSNAPDSAVEGGKVEAFLQARTDYIGRINDVFVHGSDAGWAATQKLDDTMPPSSGSGNLPPFDTVLDEAAFRTAFNELLSIRCSEASAVARSSCSIA